MHFYFFRLFWWSCAILLVNRSTWKELYSKLTTLGMPSLTPFCNLSGRFRAAVPSGASTGIHEALELRDKGKDYHGKGILLCSVWLVVSEVLFVWCVKSTTLPWQTRSVSNGGPVHVFGPFFLDPYCMKNGPKTGPVCRWTHSRLSNFCTWCS